MKYFVVSDVHGFYSIMKEALDKVGYDPNNKDHFFISCGDLFDRGEEARECLNFIMSLPKDRRAFIEGNHESCLIKILSSNGNYSYADVHNGTVDTIRQLSGVSNETDMYEAVNILKKDKNLNTYLHELKDYYEIKDYIFVHGWIPRRYDEEVTSGYTYNDFRNATKEEWDESRWICGFNEWSYMNQQMKEHKMNPIGKTIVCGHWHTAYAHAMFHKIGTDLPRWNSDLSQCHFEPFIDEGIIGIDACTVLSKRVNVLVIDEYKSYKDVDELIDEVIKDKDN